MKTFIQPVVITATTNIVTVKGASLHNFMLDAEMVSPAEFCNRLGAIEYGKVIFTVITDSVSDLISVLDAVEKNKK